MNTADPLAQLRDIHLPEPISWWPPAPGWWIVLLVALASIILSILCVRNWWLCNRYRRTAIRELSNLKNNPQDNQQTLREISTLLRRVALQTYGRKNVAPLSGDQWLTFLDRTGKTDQFSQGPAKVLGCALYQSSVEADTKQVIQIIHKWIKEHRR